MIENWTKWKFNKNIKISNKILISKRLKISFIFLSNYFSMFNKLKNY